MKTLSEIEKLIKKTRYFTIPEVKRLRYEALSTCPRGRGLHDWFYPIAKVLKELPFNDSPEKIQIVVEAAVEEFARKDRQLV